MFYLISGFSVLDIEKGNTDECELKILLRHMMRKEKGIFTSAAELAVFVFVKPLTVSPSSQSEKFVATFYGSFSSYLYHLFETGLCKAFCF